MQHYKLEKLEEGYAFRVYVDKKKTSAYIPFEVQKGALTDHQQKNVYPKLSTEDKQLVNKLIKKELEKPF